MSFEIPTSPDLRAEGACELVMIVGLDIGGSSGPTSCVIPTVPEFGFSGTVCTSLNL